MRIYLILLQVYFNLKSVYCFNAFIIIYFNYIYLQLRYENLKMHLLLLIEILIKKFCLSYRSKFRHNGHILAFNSNMLKSNYIEFIILRNRFIIIIFFYLVLNIITFDSIYNQQKQILFHLNISFIIIIISGCEIYLFLLFLILIHLKKKE